MKESVVRQLLQINDTFYNRFGKAFAETRRRIQPGVERVLNDFVRDGDWLDLGCGSGTLGCVWARQGMRGLYEGLDLSPVLVAEARAVTAAVTLPEGLKLTYAQTDLGKAGWQAACSLQQYDGVLMFAAMHHVPSAVRRLALMKEIAGLLRPGARFIHSEWQFQRSAKLMTHMVPWSKTGIDPAELEQGDTLLDWRHTDMEHPDETGLRYVHLFTADELCDLAEASGFSIEAEFDSDGAGGNLSLYQVWQKLQ